MAAGYILLACALLATAPSRAGAAAPTHAISSSNWAGYVAFGRGSARSFASVSGVWRQPSATCTPGHETYSAVWVGLGGFGRGARALEQAGTDADCTRSGHALYSAWYELIPAASVRVSLAVAPGQELAVAVTAGARRVTLGIRNLSTGARFTRTLRARPLDASSAEWIVEAPQACLAGHCRTLSLTDFGEADFAGASAASARGHRGTILDPFWSAAPLELRQTATGGAEAGGAPADVIVASPSPPTSAGAFAVTWREGVP